MLTTPSYLDLTVNATAEKGNDTGINDTVGINYTARNIGDIPAGEVFNVTLYNKNGQKIDSDMYADLEPGAKVNGTLEGELDRSGGFRISIDSNNEIKELNETNNNDSAVLLRPDLTVKDVSEDRVGAQEVEFGVTVANLGKVNATGAQYTVRNNGTVISTGQVDVRYNSTKTTKFNASPGDINTSLPTRVVLDPSDSISEVREDNNVYKQRSLLPDLVVGSPNYNGSAGNVDITVPVGNGGAGNATGSLRVRNESGDIVANKSVSISAPVNVTAKFDTVSINVPVNNGDIVYISVSAESSDMDVSNNVVRSVVDNVSTFSQPLLDSSKLRHRTRAS